MKNPHPFIHHSSVALLACGLVTTLLLGPAAGQHGSEEPLWLDYEYKIEINDLKGPEWSKGLPLYQVFLHRHTRVDSTSFFQQWTGFPPSAA
jgi:hypothetical protein